MARKSSINFKACRPDKRGNVYNPLYHNHRRGYKAKTVYEERSGNNIYSSDFSTAHKIDKEHTEKANQIRYDLSGKYSKAKIYHYEAVLNITENTTLDDVKRVAERVERKFGFKCYSYAIHRDEGHFDKKTKEFIINEHAHLCFNTLSAETGLNNACRLTKSALAELQTEVSQILNMERGEIGSKKKRLEHREYKIHQQRAEQELGMSLAEAKTELNAFKRDKIDFKALKSQIKELEAEIKDINLKHREELAKAKSQREQYKTLEMDKKQLDELVKELKELVKGKSYEKDYQKELDKLKQSVKNFQKSSYKEAEKIIDNSKNFISYDRDELMKYLSFYIASAKNYKNAHKELFEASQIKLQQVENTFTKIESFLEYHTLELNKESKAIAKFEALENKIADLEKSAKINSEAVNKTNQLKSQLNEATNTIIMLQNEKQEIIKSHEKEKRELLKEQERLEQELLLREDEQRKSISKAQEIGRVMGYYEAFKDIAAKTPQIKYNIDNAQLYYNNGKYDNLSYEVGKIKNYVNSGFSQPTPKKVDYGMGM